MSNLITRANYAQAWLGLEQARLKLKSQEQQIDLEVSNAVRAVETNYQRAKAYKATRELAEKNLKQSLKNLK